jgi:hypothetical protein
VTVLGLMTIGVVLAICANILDIQYAASVSVKTHGC